ncbi:unnamed protein product [Psylliodes chrysocephalus]|uniref:Uncharacterized protein n=1 Tax=Psylliodes chrysocephalus TaxID=3402493 RepID=A0A9P0CL65_9CUCU|nr:unnamed protein product [Psylliodes chrysocephala]
MIFTVDQTVEAGNRENELKLKMPDDKNHKCDSPKPKSILVKTHMYFKEYCNSTSIHGFKYFAESRSLCERLLWLILVLFSISACVYLIVQTYVKFQQSPVIVSFATTNTPIYTIPFPAVTICPLSKAKNSLFNFTKVMGNSKMFKKDICLILGNVTQNTCLYYVGQEIFILRTSLHSRKTSLAVLMS